MVQLVVSSHLAGAVMRHSRVNDRSAPNPRPFSMRSPLYCRTALHESENYGVSNSVDSMAHVVKG